MDRKSLAYANQEGRQKRKFSEGAFILHLPWLLTTRYNGHRHRENDLGAR